MYRNRLVQVGAVLAAAGALVGAPGSAHAQASGTLQATAVVLDDAVNRELEAELDRLRASGTVAQGAIALPSRPVTVQIVVPTEPADDRRGRIKIELIYM